MNWVVIRAQMFPGESWPSVNSRLEESNKISRAIDCESDFTPESQPR